MPPDYQAWSGVAVNESMPNAVGGDPDTARIGRPPADRGRSRNNPRAGDPPSPP